MDYCIIFSPSKDKIDAMYASPNTSVKIEDDGDLNNHLGEELE